jgi:hypothetical protein
LIALRIEAELFEPEHGAHPRAAADTGNADSFAAQASGCLMLSRATKS